MKHHLKVRMKLFKPGQNGNVTIKMGAVTDRLNTQRVKPYKLRKYTE